MAIRTYTQALQNGILTHPSYIEDETLYRKILQDGSPSGTAIVLGGSLTDVRQYLTSECFNIPYDISSSSGWAPGMDTWFSVFPNYFESAGTGLNNSYVLATNGLFESRVDSADNTTVTSYAEVGVVNEGGTANANCSIFRVAPVYYARNEFNPDSSPRIWFRVLGNDYLDCVIVTVEVTFNSYNNVWGLTLYTGKSGSPTKTYRDFINELSDPLKTDLFNYYGSVEPDNKDPYGPGGYSDIGGGENTNFSEDSDTVTVDPLPTVSAIGTGFSTIFIPTEAQLKRLSQTFWGSTIVGFFQNAITNISEMFVSLGILPFQAPTGATVNVSWLDIATVDIPLTLAAQQLIEFDLGYIDMANDPYITRFDSVLDYSPYSRLGIYLPFIGYQELDIDECRNAVIQLIYRIDILSGSCVAIIRIAGNDIYQFSGNCLTQIPLTSADMSGLIDTSVQVAVAAASMGASAAVASAGDAVASEMASAGKITTGQLEAQNAQHAAQLSNAKGSLASATANGMMGMKPNFKKSGAVSASTSLLNVRQPYLFLVTPRQSYPENYARYCGFPSNITGELGSFKGYTVVEDIRLNGLVATSAEVEEIYNLLKSGVII